MPGTGPHQKNRVRNQKNSQSKITKLIFVISPSIEANRIGVLLKANDTPDDGKELLRQLHQESTKTYQNGAAFRWAVAANDDMDITLQLHSLPYSAATIKAKPALQKDNIAVQVQAGWIITADQFAPSTGLYGPIPVLFATDIDNIRPRLEENQDQIFRSLNSLSKR